MDAETLLLDVSVQQFTSKLSFLHKRVRDKWGQQIQGEFDHAIIVGRRHQVCQIAVYIGDTGHRCDQVYFCKPQSIRGHQEWTKVFLLLASINRRLRRGGTDGTYRLLSRTLFDYAVQNSTGKMSNGAWDFARVGAGLPDYPANFSLLGGYVRGTGHNISGAGFTASSGAFCAIGGGSTLWMVDPARDLTFVFLSAGFIEGLDHLQRLCRLSDLALASCVA